MELMGSALTRSLWVQLDQWFGYRTAEQGQLTKQQSQQQSSCLPTENVQLELLMVTALPLVGRAGSKKFCHILILYPLHLRLLESTKWE